MMTNSILIVMALESECRGRFSEENTLYTGVGKVNSAYHLTKRIMQYRPEMVVNLGSAGSPYFNSGTVVNCTQFIQRDMNVEPLGFEKWVTPFEDNVSVLHYGEQIDDLAKGICGTGDSFDTSGRKEIYTLVDMEAYALAKVCQLENIPFICIKYISDGADGKAAEDWSLALEDASKKLFAEYKRIQQDFLSIKV